MYFIGEIFFISSKDQHMSDDLNGLLLAANRGKALFERLYREEVAKNETLQQEIETLQAQGFMSPKFDNIQEDYNRLRDMYEALQSKHSAMLETAVMSSNAVMTNIHESMKDGKEASAKVQSLEGELCRVQRLLEELNSKLSVTQSDLAVERRAHKAQKEELQKTIESLDREKASHQKCLFLMSEKDTALQLLTRQREELTLQVRESQKQLEYMKHNFQLEINARYDAQLNLRARRDINDAQEQIRKIHQTYPSSSSMGSTLVNAGLAMWSTQGMQDHRAQRPRETPITPAYGTGFAYSPQGVPPREPSLVERLGLPYGTGYAYGSQGVPAKDPSLVGLPLNNGPPRHEFIEQPGHRSTTNWEDVCDNYQSDS